MQNRKFNRAISAVVALVMVLSILPSAVFARTPGNDGSAEMNEAYASRESLMPIGPSFNVDTLLEWTPEADPDAAYSRASIKLADRVGGFVVNPVANPEAKLMLCSLANSDHDHTSAQGTESFLSWAFNYWQYTDSFVYWSGSQEGLVVVPTGEFTDAAHTNGVPVVATLGFPWGSGEGYGEQVTQFVQQAEDGSFPVADKLIQVMDYYGFDGYFFNQESYNCGPEEGRLIEEMMRYMHRMRPDMLISWYDSMLPEGGVSYQDSVNDRNKQFMKVDENGIVPVDEFMMNYNWTANKVNTTVYSMESVGRSPFDAFAGLDVQQNCMDTPFRYDLLTDEDGLLKISVAMYCPNSTLGLSPNGEAFHRTEQKFYTNNDGDPRVEQPGGRWKGMSRFFADKTPILTAPFVTNFNSGHGKGYYVDGQLSRNKEWSYQSIQDVMPTWTWIIDSTGSDANCSGAYDFDTVFNGGSSICFEGSLTDADGKHNVMLYSTDVTVKSGMSLELTSMLTGTPAVSVVLYLDDGTAADYAACQQVLLPTTSGADWTNDIWKLDSYAGKTIKAIGFEIAANGTAADAFKLNLGRLAILDKARRDTAAAKNFRLEDILYKDAYKAEARIAWDAVTGASGYLITQVMADGSKQVLMETPNNFFYLPTLVREAGQANVTLEVAGINRNGQLSSKPATLVIPWKYQDGDTDDTTPVVFTNLCLNAPVIDVSFENSGEPASKALDGTSENNSKWCATNYEFGHMKIDLGEPKTVNRWRVEHAEYGGEAHNMNTIDFSLQYYDEASQTFKTAKEFWGNEAAVTDVLLDEPVTAQIWKLDITDSGSSPWGGIRIYEWQMFSERALPAPTNIPMGNVRCLNNLGTADSISVTNAPAGMTLHVYRDGQELTSGMIAEDGTLTLSFDLGTAEAGKVQYTVSGDDGVESPKLCAEFFAEGKVSEQAQDVSFRLYQLPGSNTSYSYDGSEAFTTLTVGGLSQGDVVRVYENGPDAAATKVSAPMAAGASTASVIGVPVAAAGDTVLISVQRAGQAESEKYSVSSPAFDGATGTVQVFAKNEKGESLTGVMFELLKNGEVVGQIGTTSDSGGKAAVPFGTYTIHCTSVPAGYDLPADVVKIVSIENWVYPITVNVTGEAAVGPTDPSDPSIPADPEVEALVKAAQAAQAAAENAQAAAQAAQEKAEAAQAAAEEAAQSSAADKTAAEAAQAKAEEARTQAEAAQAAAVTAQAAAEEAAAAAEASNLAAAEEAREAAEAAAQTAQDAEAAAESARQAAAAQKAAQSAQAAAEAAQAVAEQAKADAEAAREAAEKAAQSSASDKEAAENAAKEAAAAQEAAQAAQRAAEDAQAAAEKAKNEAAASNEAAAGAAEEAAKAAREAAAYYQEITEMKSQMAEYLEDTQASKEAAEEARKAAEAAELACAKYYNLYALSKYADKDDYRATEQKLLSAAIDDGISTINAATTAAEADAALAAAKAAIDKIPTAEQQYLPFTDVKEGDWFENAVRYVYRNDIFNGTGDSTFAPRQTMTRGQMIAAVYRLAGEPDAEAADKFTDMKADAYYAKAVAWGVSEGVVNGTSDNSFSPNAPITRAQAAAFLYRYTKAEKVEQDHLQGFADADTVPAFAVEALNWAVANEILTGAQAGENLILAADRQINRAEVASLIMRLSEK